MMTNLPRILIDITHTAQFNFYINIIKTLSEEYFLIVTVLNRGILPEIAQKELAGIKNIQIRVIGKKGSSKWATIWNANLLRILKLFLFSLGKTIRISFANGYHPCIVGRLLGFKSITFDDDPQVYDYRIKLAFANKVYYCLYNRKFADLNNKAKISRCIKEWAYLNPDSFSPNSNILSEYRVKPKEYIFIREVNTNTWNYSKQRYGKVLDIVNQLPENYKIVFSLEDKGKRDLYPKDWIMLEEPVRDIHSLIYYSKLLISSGDSMAREAATLGIPGIYVGHRKMYANSVLEELADFYHYTEGDFKSYINEIIQRASDKRQESIRKFLDAEFIDINKFAKRITRILIR